MKILIYSAILILILNAVSYAQQKIVHIKVPPGYKRILFPSETYSGYIQRLPLKKNKIIYEWNGSRLLSSFLLYNVLAVVNKPVLFRQDLEQCADYAMRFWADYHKENKLLNKLFLLDYMGNKKYFKDSNKSYLKYLRWHMAYSNSYSIKKGLKIIDMNAKLIPGDMFVQNKDGGVGHVSVIVDIAENERNNRIYLIGFSFMPAQEFHIEDAGNRDNAGAWFTKSGYIRYLAKSSLSYYGEPVFRRF